MKKLQDIPKITIPESIYKIEECRTEAKIIDISTIKKYVFEKGKFAYISDTYENRQGFNKACEGLRKSFESQGYRVIDIIREEMFVDMLIDEKLSGKTFSSTQDYNETVSRIKKRLADKYEEDVL